MAAMRIALVSPYSVGPMRGNITTVRRIARSLAEAGAEVAVLPIDAMTFEEMQGRLSTFSPQIIHGFHALYCGETARRLAASRSIPFVMTLTGSDITDVAMREHPDTLSALQAAARIICFDASIAATVGRHFPASAGRLCVIPQGVSPLPLTGGPGFGLPPQKLVLLLPAALRPVKNVEFAVRALSRIPAVGRPVMLVIAGGGIDPLYTAGIRQLIAGNPSVAWLGEVAYGRMGDLYSRADVVLNCSHFEGMPNSLMEAMALGRPVLAADIPGNSLLVRHNETGLLYRDAAEFIELVMRLRDEAALRERLGACAVRFVHENFLPRREAEHYLRMYEDVLQGRAAPCMT
jgi:glycosyltransferase involved in cell wall biosynthesis